MPALSAAVQTEPESRAFDTGPEEHAVQERNPTRKSRNGFNLEEWAVGMLRQVLTTLP
jgi:hypothetical protein